MILGFMDRQGLTIGSRRLTDTKLPPLQPPWLLLKQERPGFQSREVIPLGVMTMICSTSRRVGNTYWNTDEFVDFISCNTYVSSQRFVRGRARARPIPANLRAFTCSIAARNVVVGVHSGRAEEGQPMSGVGQSRNLYPEELSEKSCDLLAGDKSAGSSTGSAGGVDYDPLWSPEQVAQRLNVSPEQTGGSQHFLDTMNSQTFEPLLSDPQVAKLLSLHPKTVQRLARAGLIPAHRVGRYWRYRASELNEWIGLQLSCQPACVVSERTK